MGLFQKRPPVTDSAPAYTTGATRNVLIIGLGNPGKEYDGTRHNIGFEVIDKFAADNDFGQWIIQKDLGCELSVHTLGDSRVILCKPTTFMNDSGQAAVKVQHFYRVYNQNTLAVYDELAIPFGSLRTRLGGSDAGHNGVKSLIANIGNDFGRLRIGVGSPLAQKADTAEFVLAKFNKKEQGNLAMIVQEANAMINEYIFGGQLPHDTRTIL